MIHALKSTYLSYLSPFTFAFSSLLVIAEVDLFQFGDWTLFFQGLTAVVVSLLSSFIQRLISGNIEIKVWGKELVSIKNKARENEQAATSKSRSSLKGGRVIPTSRKRKP